MISVEVKLQYLLLAFQQITVDTHFWFKPSTHRQGYRKVLDKAYTHLVTSFSQQKIDTRNETGHTLQAINVERENS